MHFMISGPVPSLLSKSLSNGPLCIYYIQIAKPVVVLTPCLTVEAHVTFTEVDNRMRQLPSKNENATKK